MATNNCSHCLSQGRHLENLSRDAMVDYYRCHCGHVWTVSKDERHQHEDVTYRVQNTGAAARQTAPLRP